MERNHKKSYVVGINTEGGSVYGIRLVAELLSRGHRVVLILKHKEASLIDIGIETEMGQWIDDLTRRYREQIVIRCESDADTTMNDVLCCDGMILIPCSMDLVQGIVEKREDSFLLFGAKMFLEQRKELIVVPNQSPFTEKHLEHLLFLARLRVKIVPAMPELDKKPLSLDAMIHHVVSTLLDNLGIE